MSLQRWVRAEEIRILKQGFSKSRSRTAGAVLIGGLLSVGCSGGEDVRVRLCKDLVAVVTEAPGPVDWLDVRVEMRRSADLTVALEFVAAGGSAGTSKPRRAACHYRWDAPEDNMLTQANPASAYSSSPSRMTLDGRPITNPRLAEAIKQAMLKQGRELLGRAQQGIQDAARGLRGPSDAEPPR